MSESADGLARRTDDELAVLALKGDDAAWGEAARRHTHRVVVTLLARGIPLDVAEDLAQEAWLRLIERQRRGSLTELRLPGLAVAQAEWLARDAVRTETRRGDLLRRALGGDRLLAVLGHDRVEIDPHRRMENGERIEVIQEELSRCSRRAREVFYGVYGPGGAAPADVARSLGISVQRVRQILTETRARLREALERWEGRSREWNT